MRLPFRSKAEVSGGTIRWDYHLEAIAEVSGGIIKWTYHFEVKGLSDGTIRWDYLLEVKQRYHVELSGRSMPIRIRCIRHFEVKANV